MSKLNLNDKFITIEGVDGAGKSTALDTIEKYLVERGQTVIRTAEPGGTALGRELRHLVKTTDMDLTTETMLLFSARAEHIKTVIKPALENGAWVLCDRFTDSTIAYQHYAKGMEYGKIKSLIDLVQEGIQPNITFILDVPLHVSRARIAKRGEATDRFEAEKDAFFQKVIDGYKNIAKKEPSRCQLIDAQATPDVVSKAIQEKLEFLFLKQIQKEKNPELNQGTASGLKAK